MKKEYIKPFIILEHFNADEYVAACVVGTIQCAIPGRSSTELDDGTRARKGEDGLDHGLCGNNAVISFDSDLASGYEVLRGKKQMDRPIFQISGYELKEGTYMNVTWKSEDGHNHTGTYSHYGRLIIESIDENRPNHS